ncbi:MAG: HNH endonuclease signature motif containing protein [Ilumatobacteraceae bacterium]
MPDLLDDLRAVDAVVGLSDAELLAECRSEELGRRVAEGRLIERMIELDRRRLYVADGYTCLAAWGRGAHRWEPLEARSRRNLVKLVIACPQVLERLLAGGLGVAQAHLLGRLFKAPRIGRFVPLFIDDFLAFAAEHDYVGFEQHCRAWKLLMDQDGSKPADWDRRARLGFTDHEFLLSMSGPAADGAKWQALLARFERIEWELDWEHARAVHGDDACSALLARTSEQRRYDALQNLRSHVTLPPRGQRDEPVDAADADVFADGDGGGGGGGGEADAVSEPARARPAEGRPDGAVTTVVDIVVDLQTFLHGLDRVFGIPGNLAQRPPFGPDRARCQTLDGVSIHPRDAALAALYGTVRLVVTDEFGRPVQMTSASRLFTGNLRQAALMGATTCTHPGCLVLTTHCQVDHLVPHSHGGPTQVDNGGPGCRHHNNWRYTARAQTRLRDDGVWTTHRADGSRIAPAD